MWTVPFSGLGSRTEEKRTNLSTSVHLPTSWLKRHCGQVPATMTTHHDGLYPGAVSQNKPFCSRTDWGQISCHSIVSKQCSIRILYLCCHSVTFILYWSSRHDLKESNVGSIFKTNLVTWFPSPEPTWWKKNANYHKLASDVHSPLQTHVVMCVPACTQACTQMCKHTWINK